MKESSFVSTLPSIAKGRETHIVVKCYCTNFLEGSRRSFKKVIRIRML